jgi:hypothetical protein
MKNPIKLEDPKQTIEVPSSHEARLVLNANELRGLKPGEGHDAALIEWERVYCDEENGEDETESLSGTLYAACEFGEVEERELPASLRCWCREVRGYVEEWVEFHHARLPAIPEAPPRRLPTPEELRAHDRAVDAHAALEEEAMWKWAAAHGNTLPSASEHLVGLPPRPTPPWLA